MSMLIDLRVGNCLEVMKQIPDASVDMVLCDLPYGTTACKWDSVIPFPPLWEQYARLLRTPKSAVVLHCAQPFTSALVMSNPKWFRHEWIWDKVRPSGFQIAKYTPMRRHESLCVFSKESPSYFPIMVKRDEAAVGCVASRSDSSPLAHSDGVSRSYLYKFPQSILDSEIGKAAGVLDFCKPAHAVHPTEKPVALLSYLLQCYSKPQDTILDNTMGSGSTGVACVAENRNFIGIEQNPEYFAIAQARITKEQDCPRGHYAFGVDYGDKTEARLVPAVSASEPGFDFEIVGQPSTN